jgi:hypothetical protein
MAGNRVAELRRIADEKYVEYKSPPELCSNHRMNVVVVYVVCGNERRTICIHCGEV